MRPAPVEADRPASSCFLLYELGVGEVVRAPAEGCATRVTPASTFKIPHALAALDAGVLSGPDAMLRYDGASVRFDAWRRDHTLASAMRYSVVWYFQGVARLLGEEREQLYLGRFGYGNQDPSSGLESFWLGGSLLISPDEQERFLARLYENALPVSERAMQDRAIDPRSAAGGRRQRVGGASLRGSMAGGRGSEREDGQLG